MAYKSAKGCLKKGAFPRLCHLPKMTCKFFLLSRETNEKKLKGIVKCTALREAIDHLCG